LGVTVLYCSFSAGHIDAARKVSGALAGKIKAGPATDFKNAGGTIVAAGYWFHNDPRASRNSFGWAAWTKAIKLWRGRAEKSDNLGNPYAEKMLQRRSQSMNQ
jgi:hypothetical protein